MAAILAMARKIPILAPVDALPFLPAEYGSILDIKCLLGIVRQLVWIMWPQAQALLVVDDALVPREAPLFPVVKPLLHLARMPKQLQVPLPELTPPEQHVPCSPPSPSPLPDLP